MAKIRNTIERNMLEKLWSMGIAQLLMGMKKLYNHHGNQLSGFSESWYLPTSWYRYTSLRHKPKNCSIQTQILAKVCRLWFYSYYPETGNNLDAPNRRRDRENVAYLQSEALLNNIK